MKKSLFNFITGGAAVLLAIILKVYCAAANVSGSFFDIFCLILAAGGISLVAWELLRRSKLQKEEYSTVEKLSTQEFEQAGTETLPVYDSASIFRQEFDTSVAEDKPHVVESVAEGVAADHLAYVDAQLQFPDAVQELLTYTADQGCRLSADNAHRLFAALSASRLLILRNMDSNSFRRFMQAVGGYFGSGLYLDRVDNSYDRPDRLLFCTDADGNRQKTQFNAALSAAGSAPHRICFAALDHVDPRNMESYFSSLIKYVRNPQSGAYLTANNAQNRPVSYPLPSNLWLVLNLAEDASPATLPDAVCDVAVVEQFSFEPCAVQENGTAPRAFSCHQMDYLADRAVNRLSIPEDQWKKIDQLEQEVSGHGLIDNKLWLCLERYAYVYLSCEEDVSLVLDNAICAKLLVKLLAYMQSIPSAQRKNLIEITDHVLGEEGSTACRKFLRDCGPSHS